MELQQVRYFLALARTLNFSRAAEDCRVSQPALTKAIHKLEQELGGELFERGRRRIELTELGRLIQPALERALEASKAAQRFAREFASQDIAPLRIGLSPSISAGLMARPLAELARRIVGLRIDLIEYPTDRLVEGLFEAKLHVAIAGDAENWADRIDHWPLFEEPILVGMAPQHPFACYERVPLAALAETAWIGRRGCELWMRFHTLGFPAAAPHIGHWASREGHVLSMASAGFGAFLVPEHAPLPTGLVTRRIEGDPVRRQVQLLTIAGRRYSPALDSFVKIARLLDWSEHPPRAAGSCNGAGCMQLT